LYIEEDPDVSEAIRRLPEEEQYQRLFRLKRALDLNMKKAVLPRDQWTKPEEVIDAWAVCPHIVTEHLSQRNIPV
jgi:ubiquinol-cytochrome c reductase subunit 7